MHVNVCLVHTVLNNIITKEESMRHREVTNMSIM